MNHFFSSSLFFKGNESCAQKKKRINKKRSEEALRKVEELVELPEFVPEVVPEEQVAEVTPLDDESGQEFGND